MTTYRITLSLEVTGGKMIRRIELIRKKVADFPPLQVGMLLNGLWPNAQLEVTSLEAELNDEWLTAHCSLQLAGDPHHFTVPDAWMLPHQNLSS